MDTYIKNKINYLNLCERFVGGGITKESKFALPSSVIKANGGTADLSLSKDAKQSLFRQLTRVNGKKRKNRKLSRADIIRVNKKTTDIWDEINSKYVMKKDLDFFVGKEVYIKYDVKKRDDDDPKFEWIWALIKDVDRDNDCLIGTVDVKPQFIDLKYGDELCVKREDVKMIQIIDLVNFFMHLIDDLKHKDIDEYYSAIFKYIQESNLDGSFYEDN